jgi:hypothetical protein
MIARAAALRYLNRESAKERKREKIHGRFSPEMQFIIAVAVFVLSLFRAFAIVL